MKVTRTLDMIHERGYSAFVKVVGWVASMAMAFLAGWGIGRGGSSGSVAMAPLPPPLEAKEPAPARSVAKARGRRLRDASQETQLEEWEKIPRSERAAAMRAWLGSFGFGGPSAPDLDKMRTVIDRWAVEDFDAAWQWAEGLADPVAREFAVVGVVGALSETDPQKAIKCLATLGEIQRPITDWRIGRMLQREANRSVAAGPEALKGVWEKVPLAGDSVDFRSGDYLDLSKVEDLAPYADALREIRESGDRPFTLGGAMKEWAKRDVAAATDYLIDRGLSEKVDDEWRELLGSVREAGGENAANAWMLEALAKVPLPERAGFLDRISYLQAPEAILGLDAGLYGEGERIDHATAFVWATIQREDSIEKIMSLIPETERIEVIGRLRGVTKAGPLAAYLRRQGKSEAEISRISGEAVKPWE